MTLTPEERESLDPWFTFKAADGELSLGCREHDEIVSTVEAILANRILEQSQGFCSTAIILEPPCAFINANQRLHFHKRNELTQAWRLLARNRILTLRQPLLPKYDKAHIVITYRFPNNHRREVANLQPTSKAIVDGLVDAGVLPDDDDLHVIGPDNRREWPNGEPRVTVTIREVAA